MIPPKTAAITNTTMRIGDIDVFGGGSWR